MNGLLQMNTAENRGKVNLDKAFIKALIIGLGTLKKIENGEPIHKDILVFIKGYNFHSIESLSLNLVLM